MQTAVVNNEITHQDYLDCLFNDCQFRHSQVTIRAFKHQLFTIQQEKTSLTNTDDKRIILPDGVHTLPYGYRPPH